MTRKPEISVSARCRFYCDYTMLGFDFLNLVFHCRWCSDVCLLDFLQWINENVHCVCWSAFTFRPKHREAHINSH